MTEETEGTQALPAGEAVATPDTTTSDAGTETTETTATETQAADTTEGDGEKPKRTPWFEKRMAEITREKWEARREAEELRAQLSRFQQPVEQDPNQPRQLTEADFQRAVEAAAAQKLSQSQFDAECNAAYQKGAKEYADFDTALSNFRMLGGLPPHMAEAAIATGEGHKVLYALGKDPDRAAEIMSLPPVRMAVELAKLANAPAKAAAPKPVSNAPPPVRPVDGAARASDNPDSMTMDQWVQWRQRQLEARKA